MADDLHKINSAATEMAVSDLDWVMISLDRASEELTKALKKDTLK